MPDDLSSLTPAPQTSVSSTFPSDVVAPPSPPSLLRPPVAHLAPASPRQARGALPTTVPPPAPALAATSSYIARHPDLSRPNSSSNVLAVAGAALSVPPRDEAASIAAARSRSSSAGSLRSLLIRSDSDLTRRASESIARPPLYGPRMRASSRSSTTLESVQDAEEPIKVRDSEEAAHVRDGAKNDLGALSWGKWWPFAVIVPPSSQSSTQDVASHASQMPSPSPSHRTSQEHEQDRSFLSYFAGKSTVTAVAEQHSAAQRSDEVEEALLDLDPAELAHASGAIDIIRRRGSLKRAHETLYREADEGSPMGGSTPVSASPEKSRSANPLSSALEGPTALFSSFSIPNPFAPTQARAYTTSAKDGQRAKDRDKKKVDPMLDQDDQQAVDDSHMDVFTILKDRYECPKHPIIFCHGLFGFDVIGPASIKPLQFSYWVGVKEALEGIGAEVMIGRVPASASIEERAKVLCGLIEERFAGREVNLIGHSMGGLDGRFLISHLKPTKFKVRSLTTISTPHRGSSFADFMLEDVVGQQHMPKLLTLMETVGVPGGGRAFDNLTVTKMARFNEETPDSSEVSYYSYGAEFEPGWSNVFRVPWGIIKEREGDNDGLVSVESAQWGEYKATLNNVNHLDLVGWVGKVRYGWAEWLGKPIKFKPVSFFCAVAEMLAEEGH